MPLQKFDRYLLWLLVYPGFAYCLWTKWAVVTSTRTLDNATLLDFFRLHLACYGMMGVWCTLMLRSGPGLLLIRLWVLAVVIFFSAASLSYSAAILYTGSLAPYDVSYYAARATGNLPVSIASIEWFTLFVLPLLFIVSAIWTLRQPRQHTARYGAAFALLLLMAAIPPLTPAAEYNVMRPSYVYQIAEFMSEKSLWPQAAASETSASNIANLKPVTEQHTNIVIIALESVSAQATGVYAKNRAAVTPFLNTLAKKSLVARQAYTVMPHTSKALVAINCGVTPNFMHPIFESTFGIHQRCLPRLLSAQGYNTMFFQSPTEHFENRRNTVKQLGYQTFTAHEQLDHRGFQLANYFGYEDDILLAPSKHWLQQQTTPFMAFYLTGTTHHPYWVPDRQPGQTFESGNHDQNNYLNAVHYLDRFVEKLIAQYKEAGHYDNTVFVIIGDHGESFGEHARLQHNASLYQEVMQVPLLIHAPGLIKNRQTIALASQLDIAPTVLAMAGFELTHPLEGINLTDPAQKRDFALGNCWYDDWCIASADEQFKFIHNFDQKGDELFDLVNDPLEQHNIIEQHRAWANQRLAQLLKLKKRNREIWHGFLSAQNPDYWSERDATTGTPAKLMQLAQDDPRRETLLH